MLEEKFITSAESCSILSWTDAAVGNRDDYLVCVK